MRYISDQDPLLNQFTSMIDEFGVGLPSVFGADDVPPFTYTVGLLGLGHPEVIVFGLDTPMAAALLNDLHRAIRDCGKRFASGDILAGLVVGRAVTFVDVVDSTGHFGIANRLYGHAFADGVPALQVVLPDAASRFPWEPGADHTGIPLLGPPPNVTNPVSLSG